MLKITRTDLATKSDAQLSALFQQAQRDLRAEGTDLALAQSTLATIRTEIARRAPKP